VKEAAVMRPLDIEHDAALTAPPVIEPGLHVSAGLNPLPEIVTMAPTGAALDERVILGDGVVTVNVAWAMSPVLPITVITYVPGAALESTMNVDGAINWPRPLKVQDDPAAIMLKGLLVIEHGPGPSAGLNPLPDTVTPVPIGPEFGVSVIVGVGGVTANATDVEGDPRLSIKEIAYPPGTTFATTKLPLMVPLAV